MSSTFDRDTSYDSNNPSETYNAHTQTNDSSSYSSNASQSFGSGTVGGVGFGNKSSDRPDDPRASHMSSSGAHSHSEYSSDSHSRGYGTSGANDSYGGSTDYGSGATGGVGYGNKTKSRSDSDASGGGEYALNREHLSGSDAYSGSTGYGSGTTGGVGYGNKMSSSSEKNSAGGGDSTAGKLMEKIGGMMGNEKMKQQGYEKRAEKGYGHE